MIALMRWIVEAAWPGPDEREARQARRDYYEAEQREQLRQLENEQLERKARMAERKERMAERIKRLRESKAGRIAALLAVIVGVAYGIALLFPHSHVWHHYDNDTGYTKTIITVDMPASPLVFVLTLAAEVALLYFWHRRDERN